MNNVRKAIVAGKFGGNAKYFLGAMAEVTNIKKILPIGLHSEIDKIMLDAFPQTDLQVINPCMNFFASFNVVKVTKG